MQTTQPVAKSGTELVTGAKDPALDCGPEPWNGRGFLPSVSPMTTLETTPDPFGSDTTPEEIHLHGNRVSFLRAGDGPASEP